MRNVRHKLISLGLAALYFALATAGDALHGLLPCQDGACADSDCSVGQQHCDCGHAHFDWGSAQRGNKSQAAQPGGIEWRTARQGHDASTCALCGVLGQLKVATSIAAPTAEISAPTSEIVVLTAPVRARALLRLHAARGPPLAKI